MLNSLLFFLGCIGLLVGVILTPTPIPGTTLLIILSLGLLIHTSHRAEKLMRFLRGRYEWTDKTFMGLERVIGSKSKKISAMLQKTRPSK